MLGGHSFIAGGPKANREQLENLTRTQCWQDVGSLGSQSCIPPRAGK